MFSIFGRPHAVLRYSGTQVYCIVVLFCLFFPLPQLRSVECVRSELRKPGYVRRDLCWESGVLDIGQVMDEAPSRLRKHPVYF